jgi:hypothetical protein
VLEIDHEEGDCLLGLHYLLPLASLLFLLLLLTLNLFSWLFLFGINIDVL